MLGASSQKTEAKNSWHDVDQGDALDFRWSISDCRLTVLAFSHGHSGAP